MSLLEVLKYQVSNPPTNDELWDLPSGLFEHWARSFSITDQPHPRHIANLLRLKFKSGNPTYYENMKLLKQMLLEYNEPLFDFDE